MAKVKKMFGGGVMNAIRGAVGNAVRGTGPRTLPPGMPMPKGVVRDQGVGSTPRGMVGLGRAAAGGMNPRNVAGAAAMIGKKFGGMGFGMKKGGKVSSASKRADGCAVKGKTKGKMV